MEHICNILQLPTRLSSTYVELMFHSPKLLFSSRKSSRCCQSWQKRWAPRGAPLKQQHLDSNRNAWNAILRMSLRWSSWELQNPGAVQNFKVKGFQWNFDPLEQRVVRSLINCRLYFSQSAFDKRFLGGCSWLPKAYFSVCWKKQYISWGRCTTLKARTRMLKWNRPSRMSKRESNRDWIETLKLLLLVSP